MQMILANTSWLAVIVGTVLCMVLGFLWYNEKTPTGKMWADGVGDHPSDIPMLGMVTNTIGLFLAAIFVGVAGMSLAVLAISAYGALMCTGYIFAGKSLNVGLVHLGYWFVAMIIVSVVHMVL